MSGLPPSATVKRWLVTTNHKDIGILYIITSLFFLLLGGTLALLIRTQMLVPGGTILSGMGYNQAVTAHGLLMVFWFISPFAFGLANYLVPLQIGAEDLAFPRLNALSYWLYLASGLLFALSFFQGATFAGGWTMYAPLNVPTFIPDFAIGATTAVLALVLFVASVTVSSVNFLTSMYRMRAEDLRMRDLPMFSMSILLTVWMMLFAFAALLAALVVLSSDHILGTNYFSYEVAGSLLWTHLFWFFGHPEVYIVFFPALGIMAEIFQTFSGKRLVGRKWFIIAMALVAIQSFMVWMHHMFLTSINLTIKTIFMATTIGISLPFDLMMFSLIYTLVKGKIRYTTPFLFALGSVIVFIIGGITGVFLGAVVLDYQFRGTYWVVAHFHYVMVGGVTAMIGGLYYWYPKITGRMYDEYLGKVQWGLYMLGFNLLYFPMFVVWQTPRRVFEYDPAFTSWHRLATVGGLILGLSILLMIYNLFVSLYRGAEAPDKPWAYASTAEWAVPSPPPLANFPGLPSYAGGTLSFLGTGEDATTAADGGLLATVDDDALATEIEAHEATHADHASYWPLLISAGALLLFAGLSNLPLPASPGLAVGGLFVPTSWLLFGGGPLVGGLLAARWVHRGGERIEPGDTALWLAVAAALGAGGVQVGGAYLGLGVAGGTLSLLSLVGLAGEQFDAPEAPVGERWPFADVEKTKLGMWLFLGSDIVLFGAFIGAFTFVRVAEGWQAWHDLVPAAHVTLPGLINTYLLLTSSFAVVLALRAAEKGSRRGVLAALSTTFLLGVGFLVNKGIEWQHLFHTTWCEGAGAVAGCSPANLVEGWDLTTNIASSAFYLTTGLHGAHVVVGLLITLYLLVRAYGGAYDGNPEAIEYFGLYWHFVDIVWLFLFPLFYIL